MFPRLPGGVDFDFSRPLPTFDEGSPPMLGLVLLEDPTGLRVLEGTSVLSGKSVSLLASACAGKILISASKSLLLCLLLFEFHELIACSYIVTLVFVFAFLVIFLYDFSCF